ncbi:MAG: prolyl oligopeptidase family serine peptidase [Lachnospiraceae bacterium]
MNKLKKALALLLTFLFCIPASVQTVYAEETVLEAEDADIAATSSVEWMGITDVVEVKESASGGKSIGYFGVAGNKITWTYNSVNGGAATLDFVLASGAMDMATFSNCDMTLDGMVKFTVNGTELSYSGVNLPAGANYDNWQDVIFENVMLNAGANTIVLEVVDATSVPNIDCLKITEGASAGSAGSSVEPGVEETLYLEAEDALVEAVSSMDGYDILEVKESASGGKSLGYFGVAGNKITWTIESEHGGAVTLSFVLASAAFDFATFGNGDMTLEETYVTFSLNGTKLSYAPVLLPAGNYENWQEVKINAELAEGTNTVVLEIVDPTYTPNVDCLIVYPGHTEDTGNSTGNSTGTSAGNSSNTGNTSQEQNEQGNATTGVPATVIVQEEMPKETGAVIRDTMIGIPVTFLLLALLGAVVFFIYKAVKLTEEDKLAIKELITKRKAEKAAWKKEYKTLDDNEEKEISRVSFAIERKAAKAARRAEIEAMTYGEGVRAMRNEKVAELSRPKAKYVLLLVLASVVIGGIFGVYYRSADDRVTAVSGTAGGSYSYVVEGYDWGPGVPKVILHLEGKMKPDNLEKAQFDVTVTYQGWMGATEGNRTVKTMYLSDAEGNPVDKKSEYLTLELEVGPAISESTPFYYDFMAGVNNWSNPYKYTISLTSGTQLIVDGKAYSSARFVTFDRKLSPDTEVFCSYRGEFEGITLSYAAYEPEKLTKDKVKNALIIWLHGAGEGGTDTDIDLLGNKVTALAKEEIQQYFDGNGAYVLVPQSPTMWMDDGTGEYTTNAVSKYTESLMALIDSYVKTHEDIDTNRILIGGCSNGGFMTMNMILTYPDHFAAAYPICEAYMDEWITDGMLSQISGLPIWFTHAKADPTVDPDTHTVATYQRLKAMGNNQVHFTYYDNVVDTTGTYAAATGSAYEYNGHWSWIYTLNNDCKTDFDGSAVTLGGKEVTIWEWLAARSK